MISAALAERSRRAKRFRHALVVALCVIVLAGPQAAEVSKDAPAAFVPATGASPKAAVNCLWGGDWGGDWDSTYGVIRLTQAGLSAYGNYTFDDGLLHGTLSNGVLSGTWHEEPTYEGPRDAGRFEFSISDDCTRFAGRWNYLDMAPDEWIQPWDADRLNNGQPELVMKSDSDTLTVNGRPAPADSVTVINTDDVIAGTGPSEVSLVCTNTVAYSSLFLLSLGVKHGGDLDEAILFIVSKEYEELIAKECGATAKNHPSAEKGAASNNLGLVLQQGRARTEVVDARLELEVATDNAVVTSSGLAEFETEHEPGGATRIIAIDGSIQVTPTNPGLSPVTLDSGFLIEVTATTISTPLADLVMSDGFEG